MIYTYWMGSDDSWLAVQQLEDEVAELRKSAMGSVEKQAFLFFDDYEDDSDDNRLGAHLIEKVGETAILKIGGSLVTGHSGWHRYFTGKITSYDAVIGAAQILAEDEGVSRVMMKVSSAGGAVSGVSRAAEAIRKLDAVKPVTSHVDNMAFSAGYWIASSAREVIAGDEMSEFGSIGTIAVHVSRARMAEEMGMDVTVFRAGKFKAVGHSMETLTDEAKAHLQADVDKANSFFLGHVSKRRNLMISAKDVWAEGKTFFAAEAQTVGLVDRIASFDDAIIRASGAANHRNRSYEMTISEEKLARIEAGARPEDVLTAEELTQYKASLENQEGEQGSESQEDPGKSANEGEGAGSEESPANPLSADVSTLLKENGKLEARIEVKDEQIAALQDKLDAQASVVSSLMDIGIHAIHGRQMALSQPKTTPTTPEGLVTAFHDLSKQMSATFKIGQQSREPDPSDDSVGQVPRILAATRKGA